MSQTKYKLDNNRRGIVVRFCRIYKSFSAINDFNEAIIHAIEQNRFLIGIDITNDDVRNKLRIAVWESTCNAKEYPYEVWDLPTISRNDFYERKRKFIHNIAADIGI